MTGSQLTLKQAAEDLGVHYMTVYRYVRLGTLPARKVGASWVVDAADVVALKEASLDAPGGKRRPADWKARLEARLIAGDGRGAWGTVEAALTAGLDPADVYESMLVPAMNDIGDRWAAGELDVASEHRASAVASRIVGRLGPRFGRRGRSKGTIVAAAPEGDLHSLGLAVVADLFRGAGFDVVDLGANCPTASLERAVAEAPRLVAVALSAHRADGDAAVSEAVAAARAGGARLVVVGGCAIRGADHAHSLGADAWADTGRAAVALVGEAAGA